MVAQRRWMAVGRSATEDSRSAGAEAARAAHDGPDAKLVLVFVGISHDLPAVLAGIQEVFPGVPLVGCSTHGEISPAGPGDGSVVVTAIGGVGFAVTTAVAEHVTGRQREAGTEVADAVAAETGLPYTALLVLTDGLLPDQEEILRGVYGVVGASVPLFGGAAGDGWQFEQTYQLHGDQVLTDAVVLASISSEAPLAVSVQHGWTRTGEPIVVGRCADGRVYTLDDEPAMDVYLDRLGAPPEAYTDATAFSRFALPRPVGILRRSGQVVRNLSTQVDLEQRSLGGGGQIPSGALAWVMEGNEESILAAATSGCAEAIAGLDGAPLLGMLTFSCAATRAVLGDDGIAREGDRLLEMAGGAPFAGFYTYGEIARIRGIDGFHNQTLVVLALA